MKLVLFKPSPVTWSITIWCQFIPLAKRQPVTGHWQHLTTTNTSNLPGDKTSATRPQAIQAKRQGTESTWVLPRCCCRTSRKKEAAQLDQSQNAGLSSAPPGTATQIWTLCREYQSLVPSRWGLHFGCCLESLCQFAGCDMWNQRWAPRSSRRWDVGHEQMGMGMGWDGKEKESRSNEDHRWCQNALTGEPDRFMPLILKVTNSNSELSAPIPIWVCLYGTRNSILFHDKTAIWWYLVHISRFWTNSYIYIYIILIHIHMESKVSSDNGICWNSRRDAEQKPFLSLFPPTVVFAPVEEPYRGCYGWPYSKLLALCLLRTGSHRASATCMVPARNITAAAMARNRWTHVNTPVTTDKNTSFKLNERNHRVSSKILGASWCTFVPFIFWGLVQIGSIS